jgi:hypothetical protein
MRPFAFSFVIVAALDASAVTIDWTLVGNPGNPTDLLRSYYDGSSGTHGSVDYVYRIGTYEVTNAQYAEFRNTKDPTGANTLGLYAFGSRGISLDSRCKHRP